MRFELHFQRYIWGREDDKFFIMKVYFIFFNLMFFVLRILLGIFLNLNYNLLQRASKEINVDATGALHSIFWAVLPLLI